jgi:hypothetical protein
MSFFIILPYGYFSGERTESAGLLLLDRLYFFLSQYPKKWIAAHTAAL